jgi:hypothetical protein
MSPNVYRWVVGFVTVGAALSLMGVAWIDFLAASMLTGARCVFAVCVGIGAVCLSATALALGSVMIFDNPFPLRLFAYLRKKRNSDG